MRHIIHEIPYLDTRDLNLDWLIKAQRILAGDVADMSEDIAEIEAKLELYKLPLIKVEDYGAVGDGVTDDTEAIQKCIDENPLATIFFRIGCYKISDTIHLYNQWGGQQIVFGGARIIWGGGIRGDLPMIKLDRETEHDSTKYGSACRILGGTLDGLHYVGYGVEAHAYYTTIDSLKITGFTRAGLVVGQLVETDRRISQGAHYNNIQIYQYDGDMSFEDTIGMIVKDPDSVYNQIITNRTRVGFELQAGGGVFTNCHTTIQFPAGREAEVTDEIYNTTANIRLSAINMGATQENIFSACYFNMGKYVVFSDKPSRFVTILDACFYMWYSTLPYTSITERYVILCGGYPSDFKCDSFDLMFTPSDSGYSFVDYFPTSQPTIVPLPDKINVNSNDRHPEAPIIQAWNLQPENLLTPLCSSSHPAADNVYYEVGAIVLCYNGVATTSGTTSPVTVRAYEGAGVGEWLIGFESDGGSPARVKPYIMDWHVTTDFGVLRFYIAEAPEDITIEGIVYPTYKIYMKKSAYGGIPVFMTIKNDSPFMKCYVRSQWSNDWTVPDGTGLLPLTPTINPGVSQDVIEQAVDDWLDAHPEATTTVVDGSITFEKLHSDVSTAINNNTSNVQLLWEAMDNKADLIVETAEGEIASFEDGANGIPVKSLQVEIEAVQAGSGDPSPDNVRPITGWDGCEVVRTGRNLFTGRNNEVTVPNGKLKYENGVITRTATQPVNINNLVSSLVIHDMGMDLTLMPGTYIFKVFDMTGGVQGLQPYLHLKCYDGSYIDQVYDSPFTLTQPATIEAIQTSTAHFLTDDVAQLKPYIGIGTTASEYELPNSHTYPISWVGTSGTVYGGRVNVTTGELVVTHGIVDLGDLSWTYNSGNQFFQADLSNIKGAAYTAIPNILCSNYTADSIAAVRDGSTEGITVNRTGYTYVRDPDYSDAAVFTTAMTGVQLVYELDTPLTYQLTPTQVRTLLGENNIWTDCGKVSVVYGADTKLYIDKMISE